MYRKQKILFVEDDEYLRMNYEAFFTGQTVMHLCFARDAEQALEQLARHQFDLMILDWIIPFGGGETVLATLRSKQIDVPYILATGNAQHIQAHYSEHASCIGVFEKPFSLNALLQHVQEFCQSQVVNSDE